MAFSDDIVRQAFERANEQCECNRRTHSHFRTPCGKPLVWKNRGVSAQGGWEAHHYSTSGGDTLANCEILCATCYKSVG
ncbi:MAG: hypothetical protein HY670_03930 [Chloroflexi bacterium]|nr:hypothetical protein [Chloroflexota bacterium]